MGGLKRYFQNPCIFVKGLNVHATDVFAAEVGRVTHGKHETVALVRFRVVFFCQTYYKMIVFTGYGFAKAKRLFLEGHILRFDLKLTAI